MQTLAQTWSLTPSLQTNLLVTSNRSIGTSSGAQRDYVLTVSPGLHVFGRLGQTTLSGDVAIDFKDYLRNSQGDQVAPRGRIGLTTNLIDQWLYVDTSVSAHQAEADPYTLGGRFASSVDGVTTYEYRLAPYLSRRLNSTTSLVARSDNLWTRRVGGSELDVPGRKTATQRNLARLERDAVPLGASVEFSTERSRYLDIKTDALTLDAVRVSVAYGLNPQITLGLGVGRERSAFASVGETGSIYGASMDWRWGERGSFNIGAEHRFFGWGGGFQLKQRSPFFVVDASFKIEPIVQPTSLVFAPGGDDLASLLDAAFKTRYPDPAERGQVVRNFISSQGLPSTLSSPLSLYGQYAQLRKRGLISAGLLGGNTSVFVSVHGTKSTRLLLEGSPYVPLLTDNSDYREYGGMLAISRRLGPFTNLNVGVESTRIDGLGTREGVASREKSFNVGFNHGLSPRTTVAAGLRRSTFNSNVTVSSTEFAVFIGSSHRF